MPPTETLDDYLELVGRHRGHRRYARLAGDYRRLRAAPDPRLSNFRVTPDPGVIEVNIQPSATWDELVERTTHLYEAAPVAPVAEKFMLDGRHTGTGGGNHFVFGGATTLDSPSCGGPTSCAA
jgi:uncharacterized protein (DUF2126 family)